MAEQAGRDRSTWSTFFGALLGREGIGPLLSLVASVAIGWLALTHRLQLYINPRYVTFTVVMVSLTAVFVLLKLFMASRREPGEHASEGVRPTVRSVTLVVAACGALLVAPPAALSVDAATQRQVNTTNLPPPPSIRITSLSGSTSNFDIRDWASVLRLGASVKSLAHTRFDEVGFVSPVRGRDSAFLITRLVVTCCTLDAMPVGVTVLDPGWTTRLKQGDWVRVQGTFEGDPAHPGVPVVAPRTVQIVHIPSNPYEY